MNSVSHPRPETLLQFADQDLPVEEVRSVEQHLSECGGCRDELAALLETSDDIGRFHLTVLKAALPDPPQPWGSPRWSALAPPGTPRRVIAFPLRRVLAAAAAVIGIVVLVRWMERPVRVSAAELLRNAEVREQVAPNPRRRIRIRWKNHSWTRPGRLATTQPEAGDPALIEAMLLQAGFDSEDPLSVAAFSRWRNGLAERHDHIRQDPETYVVTTSTPAGVLREASLTLRSADLHATSATLTYRSNETLDMTELPADARELDVTVPRAPAPEPVPPPAEAPAHAAGPAEEVRVIAALHRIGADLGEPVIVERRAAGILVSGAGLAPSRQEQIRAVLAGLPGVHLSFESGSNPRAPAASLPRPTAAPADSSNPLIEQLRATGNATPDAGDTVIDSADRAVQRAYAIAALARRFSTPVESALAAGDRAVVRALAADHIDVLSASVTATSALLAPLLPPVSAAPVSTANWQQTAEDLLAAARDADQEINAATPTNLDLRKSRLAAALARLRALVQTARAQLQ